jgi:1-aminocyclopropane-1-carboxylate deaminase/D-cysteine desulfhydrase-like pyridoxal-dependent ACC family enzyme
LRCILVLDTPHPEQTPQGNLLLDGLLGADVRFVATGAETAVAMEKAADDVRQSGGVPYVIPVGGSNAIGSAGYVTMTEELVVQVAAMDVDPDCVYFANGSRGTQAGIVLGARAHGLSYAMRGVIVSSNTPERVARTVDIANEAAELLGISHRLTAGDIENVDGYVGEGYAVPTAEADAAISLLARTEAIFLDPVYTAKAMSALIDHIRTGVVQPDQTVVFVHTGGAPSIFAHAERLANVSGAG